MTFKNQHTAYFSLRALTTRGEERRNLTINGKNYRNARRRSYCYYNITVNVGGEKNILVTLMHGRMKAKLI